MEVLERQQFMDEIMDKIIEPGRRRILEVRYFSEMREGKLSIKRLQGWALQHYLYNMAIHKGQILCMMKYAHDPELYKVFADKFKDEQGHPTLAKRFGFALGLKEEDFDDATPIYENVCHIGAVLRHRFLGFPIESRASGFANESMISCYAVEFDKNLRKHYSLPDEAVQWFSKHAVLDIDHARTAADFVVKQDLSPRQQRLVREISDYNVRLNIAKFEGLYQAYA